MPKPQYHWGAIFLIVWWVLVVAALGVFGNFYIAVLLLRHGQIGAAFLFAIFALAAILYCYRSYRARAELHASRSVNL
jgi:hypothetical protein